MKFITESIRNLKIGEAVLITTAAPNSVKSIVSRMRRTFNDKRRYMTRSQSEGTLVSRLP